MLNAEGSVQENCLIDHYPIYFLQDIGENIISIPEVVKEVTSRRQLRRLVVLPYDLQIKEADPDSIKFGETILSSLI